MGRARRAGARNLCAKKLAVSLLAGILVIAETDAQENPADSIERLEERLARYNQLERAARTQVETLSSRIVDGESLERRQLNQKNVKEARAIARRTAQRVELLAGQLETLRLELARPSAPITEPPDVLAEPFVTDIQDNLSRLGFYQGEIDGIGNKETVAAVKRFQTQNGLTPTGVINQELALLLSVIAADQMGGERFDDNGLRLAGTGTGFLVAARGQVLTNHHVVKDCVDISVRLQGQSYTASHIGSDADNDLALIGSSLDQTPYVRFRGGRSARPGDDVVALGFPLHGSLSDEVKVSRGSVSALSGPGNDHTLMQTTAPVQAGSSGGPLLDMSGNLVGVVVGKINQPGVENVSFAIHGSLARLFLDAHDVDYLTSPSEQISSAADVADVGRRYTVLIECWVAG